MSTTADAPRTDLLEQLEAARSKATGQEKAGLTRRINNLRKQLEEAGHMPGGGPSSDTRDQDGHADVDPPEAAGNGDEAEQPAAEPDDVSEKDSPAGGGATRSSGPREGSAMHGALEVLKGRRKPMHVNEIWAAMVERELHTSLKGKTPEATLGAQLAVHAKKGLYVEKPEPGKFQLKK